MRVFGKAARATLLLAALTAVAAAPLAAQNRDRNLITQEELDRVAQRSPNLYQAVRSLRSHMVDTSFGSGRGVRSLDAGGISGRTGATPMGTGTPMASAGNTPLPTPVLYVDGRRVGHFLQMRDLLTAEVGEVKYYDRTRAPLEMGIGHEGGAILVTMRKPTSP
jgi:hypothetical protein